jgi:hypothetical protein
MTIWTPPDKDDWGVVQDIEPAHRIRTLPDGRQFRESTLTLTPEAIEQIWQGYRCARCLEHEGIVPLGAFPERCPLCQFPMRELQREQLEQDFVGQHPDMVAGFPMDREQAFLEREHHVPKVQMVVPKTVKRR